MIFHQIWGGRESLVRNLILIAKGAEVLEIAVGAVFAGRWQKSPPPQKIQDNPVKKMFIWKFVHVFFFGFFCSQTWQLARSQRKGI